MPVRSAISMRCCVVSRRRRENASWCKGMSTSFLAFRLGIGAVQTPFWRRPCRRRFEDSSGVALALLQASTHDVTWISHFPPCADSSLAAAVAMAPFDSGFDPRQRRHLIRAQLVSQLIRVQLVLLD